MITKVGRVAVLERGHGTHKRHELGIGRVKVRDVEHCAIAHNSPVVWIVGCRKDSGEADGIPDVCDVV